MTEHLKNTLGISCVEIYSSALLAAKGIDPRALYTDSFIEIQTALEEIAESGLGFAAYGGLRRLQDIAREQGLVEWEYTAGELSKPFEAVLRGVTPDYKQSNFMPWRDDHYLLKYAGRYYDCYPPSEFNVTGESIFNGRKIGITITPACWKKHENPAAVLREKISASEYRRVEIRPQTGGLTYIRDALLIAKISRRRINDILGSDTIAGEVEELTRLINRIELHRQRGKSGDYIPDTDRLNELEETWRKRLS